MPNNLGFHIVYEKPGAYEIDRLCFLNRFSTIKIQKFQFSEFSYVGQPAKLLIIIFNILRVLKP